MACAPFAQPPAGWRLRCLRADSGFFDQALLAMLEEHAVPYIIVARMTTARKRRINSAALVWRDLGKGYAVSSFTLKLHGWGDTPGYTFRVWVTNRTEDAATLWRDYNGRATIEQRIEELKNDRHANGFCTRKFFATEATMLSAIFAYNLHAVYQAQVTPQSGWRQPSTLRAAVFFCGAVMGRIGRKVVLRLSKVGGGLAKHKALIDSACKPPEPIATLFPRARPPVPDSNIVAPGGCSIRLRLIRHQSNANCGVRVNTPPIQIRQRQIGRWGKGGTFLIPAQPSQTTSLPPSSK